MARGVSGTRSVGRHKGEREGSVVDQRNEQSARIREGTTGDRPSAAGRTGDEWFDRFAKSLARGSSRRRVLGTAAASAIGGLVSRLASRTAAQEECGEGLTYCPFISNILEGPCTDLQTDGYNCGECGVHCASLECEGGTCVSCQRLGQTECPGVTGAPFPYCANLTSDQFNCGACRNQCGSGKCENGVCVSIPCPEGLTDCGGECVNLAADYRHCGSCGGHCCAGVGSPCGPCIDGVCTDCPPGLVGVYDDLQGDCVDLATNPDHCGEPYNVCPNGTVCENGACVQPGGNPDPTPPTPEATATIAPSETPGATATLATGEAPAATATIPATATPPPTETPRATAPVPVEPRATATIPAAGEPDVVGGVDAESVNPRPTTQAIGTATCPATSEDDNEALARRWYAALGRGDLDAVVALVTDDVIHHAAEFRDAEGPSEVRATLAALLTGFPDVRFRIEQAIAADDDVVLRWTASGTHEGEFLGLNPTGEEATWGGITIFRVECGLIAEVWSELDSLGRLRQLGVLREPE